MNRLMLHNSIDLKCLLFILLMMLPLLFTLHHHDPSIYLGGNYTILSTPVSNGYNTINCSHVSLDHVTPTLAAKNSHNRNVTTTKTTTTATAITTSSVRSLLSFDGQQSIIRRDFSDMLESIAKSSFHALHDLVHYENWSTPQRYTPLTIFSCALSTNYVLNIAKFFAGTARKSGFSDDIVVAVLPGSNKRLLKTLLYYGVSVYTISIKCWKKGKGADMVCDFLGEHLPITLVRSFIYQYWALQYPDTTYIMMSDFRDVFFQSNPFTEKNKFNYWGPSAYDITFFAEHHPNRVINRCKHTSTTLDYCYGRSMTDQIGTSTIINNGVVFATRNASLIYVSFISIMTILHDYNTVDD